MEGDAGASRLTPNDPDEDPSFLEVADDDSTAEVTAEDSAESEVEADPTSTAEAGSERAETAVAVADESTADEIAEDSLESGEAADHEISESDPEDLAEVPEGEVDPRGTSRLGRRLVHRHRSCTCGAGRRTRGCWLFRRTALAP